MSTSTEIPDFTFVGDGDPADDAIAALAGLLLNLVEREATSKSPSLNAPISGGQVDAPFLKEHAS